MEFIEFSVDKYRQFKEAYDKAVREDQDQFTFEGKEVLTAYAKHILDHLEPTFGKVK